MWEKYEIMSPTSNEVIEMGLEYSHKENSGTQRIYATYVDNILFITIHYVDFNGEDLKLKIIQRVDFEIANKTIEFVNYQYKINIPLITQENLNSVNYRKYNKVTQHLKIE